MKHKNSNSNNTQKVFEKIVKKLQVIVDNGEYEKFLKFQKNFRRYSFNNLVLIFSQFPDASMVAGKNKWLELKRELLPDAQKIWILAPIKRKGTKRVKKMEDGEEIEETINYEYNSYRYVYVYDVSQTIGEPIPLVSQNLNCNDMAYFYEKLKDFSEVPVYEKKLYGAVKGYYNPTKKYIAIKDTLSLNDKAAVLLHELSHAMYDDFNYEKDRNLSEVFVESIAYIVADRFGLDTSLCSFNYIFGWAKGDPKVVLELGSKIQKCANEFINKLEKFEQQELQVAA